MAYLGEILESSGDFVKDFSVVGCDFLAASKFENIRADAAKVNRQACSRGIINA